MTINRLLTIFTPTFNRGYILPKLYESLCNQEKDDFRFEWLIIDDDSDDNTAQLVENWKKENQNFDIRYEKQIHGGKHRAMNLAFDLAEGTFLFIVDSDDTLTFDAIKSVDKWLLTIINDKSFAGVSGLRVSTNGKIWGGSVKFSDEYVDATNFERDKFGLIGDKAEIYRTDILKKFKFPEIPGEYFITEDYCWMQIAAAGYKLRWFNHPIYVCEYLDDGLTKKGANSYMGHISNYTGYCLYIKKCLELKPFTTKMQHLREFNKTMRLLNVNYKNRCKEINISFFRYLFLTVFGIPLSFAIRKVKK
ncbi:glycosyltransferase family 2 protein [Floccifex sp.]|uniref:glycosyltransferase family 2 protein n=1 Tax=Floccifex sp. TaxID=2815810 RepID=UPI003F03FFD8